MLEKPLGMGLIGAKEQTQPPIPTAHSGHCLPRRTLLSLHKEPQLCNCSFLSDFRAFRMLTSLGSASPVCHRASPPTHLPGASCSSTGTWGYSSGNFLSVLLLYSKQNRGSRMLQFSQHHSFSPPAAVIAVTELTEPAFPDTI